MRDRRRERGRTEERAPLQEVVPGAGVEPARPQGPADFKSAASASSAIPAGRRPGGAGGERGSRARAAVLEREVLYHIIASWWASQIGLNAHPNHPPGSLEEDRIAGM